MIFLIKFSFSFFISFIILSFPVNDQTVFSHLYQLTGPYTSKVFVSAKEKTMENVKDGMNFSTQLFKNSNPKHENIQKQDSVAEKLSGIKREKVTEEMAYRALRGKVVKKIKKSDLDKYTNEEQEMLKKILNDNTQ